MVIRITLPSFMGVRPSSDLRMAFSTSPMMVLSQGWTRRSLGSGADREATWLSGEEAP